MKKIANLFDTNSFRFLAFYIIAILVLAIYGIFYHPQLHLLTYGLYISYLVLVIWQVIATSRMLLHRNTPTKSSKKNVSSTINLARTLIQLLILCFLFFAVGWTSGLYYNLDFSVSSLPTDFQDAGEFPLDELQIVKTEPIFDFKEPFDNGKCFLTFKNNDPKYYAFNVQLSSKNLGAQGYIYTSGTPGIPPQGTTRWSVEGTYPLYDCNQFSITNAEKGL